MVTLSQQNYDAMFGDPMNPFGAVAPETTGGRWTAPSAPPTQDNPFGAVPPASSGGMWSAPSYAAPASFPVPTFSPAPQYQAPTFTPAPVVQPFVPTFQQPQPTRSSGGTFGDTMVYNQPTFLDRPQQDYSLGFDFSIPQGGFGAVQELDAIPRSPDTVFGELGQIGREFGQQFNTAVIEPIRSGAGLPLAMDALSLFAGQRPGATGREEAAEFGREFMQTGTSFVPPTVSEYIPDPTYFPLRTFTENTLSPMGLATILPFIGGSSSLARGLGRELLEEGGAAYGQRIASEYTDNPAALIAASLGGSVAGSLSPEIVRAGARGIGAAGEAVTQFPETMARQVGTPDLPPAGAIDPDTGMPFARVTPGGAGEEVLGPRVGPLQRGDVVVGPGGVDYTVLRDTTGGQRSFVKVANAAGEEKSIRRSMLRPVETEPPAGAIEPPAAAPKESAKDYLARVRQAGKGPLPPDAYKVYSVGDGPIDPTFGSLRIPHPSRAGEELVLDSMTWKELRRRRDGMSVWDRYLPQSAEEAARLDDLANRFMDVRDDATGEVLDAITSARDWFAQRSAQPPAAPRAATEPPRVAGMTDGSAMADVAPTPIRQDLAPTPPRVADDIIDTPVGQPTPDYVPPPTRGVGEPPLPPPPRTRVPQPDTPEFRQAARKILDATQNEVTLRRNDTIGAAIRAGRGQQATGIREVLQQGGSIEDARRGAFMGGEGSLTRDIATPAIDLTPGEREAVTAWLRSRYESGEVREFEFMFRDMEAFDKLIRGDRLQPRELQTVRALFGDEIADAVALRPKTAGQLAKEQQRFSAQAQREAARVFENAQDAERRLRAQMDATLRKNQRELDRVAARATKREQDFTAEVQREGARVFEGGQKQAARDRKALQEAIDSQSRALEKGKERFVAQMIRTQQKATEAEINAVLRDADDFLQRRARVLPEGQSRKLTNIIRKRFPDADQAQINEIDEAVREWSRANRTLLDERGEMQHATLWNIRRRVTGEAGDSFVHAILTQETILADTLRRAVGMSDETAREIARAAANVELARRYGVTQVGVTPKSGRPVFDVDVPEDVRAAIEAARKPPDPVTGGAAQIVADAKSIAFGLDIGLLGVQGLKSIQGGGIPALAAAVNRFARVFGAGMDPLAGANPRHLSRQVMYTLDGLAAPGARSAIIDEAAQQTALRWVPGLKRIDPYAARAIDALFSWQARMTLTPIRNLIYEGNLIMARAAGADISDPGVRRMIAERTNAVTTYGRPSVVKGRQAAESALALTPTMRRAQVKELGFFAKAYPELIRTAGRSPEARAAAVVATASILSYATSVLLFGKVMHDMFAPDGAEFEMDPSKPGFGNVSLPGGKVVNMFPQQQVAKTIARAARFSASGEMARAGDELTKLGLGTASPVLGAAARSAGYGFDAQAGRWALGDWGEGLSGIDRILPMLPLPIWLQELIVDTPDSLADVAALGAEFAGFSTFNESPYYARNRQLSIDSTFDQYRNPGAPDNSYENLSPEGKMIAREKYGEVPSSNRDTRAVQERSAAAKVKYVDAQADLDRQFLAGEKSGAEYRELRSALRTERSAELRGIWSAAGEFDGEDTPLTRYYDVIDQNRRRDRSVDWDAVDAYTATLSPEDLAYIDRNTGLDATPVERDLKATRDALDTSGYFDLYDAAFERFKAERRAAGDNRWEQYADYDAWREASIQYTIQNTLADMDPRDARIEAERRLTSGGVYKALSDIKNGDLETEWINTIRKTNPDVFRQAIRWGYFEPTKEQRAYLQRMGYIE